VLGERCKILVIGRGEDQARVEAAVARLGVTDHVIFGGFQSDTAAMMAAFDLYVAASAQETFGLSVLEAMASGLPVLYTTCPALDGIQTSQARQVTGTAEALGAEIRKAVEAGPLPARPTTPSSSVTAWSRSCEESTTSTNGSWRTGPRSSRRRRAARHEGGT
jgi:glycosyltransferase involved in cell wall biosynthesis